MHVLSVLAEDIGELALSEKNIYSPVFKRWHSLAAGVSAATLHSCYGDELKRFIVGISELTPDAIQVLRAADKLEKDLVQIAVEDAAESDDGGKSIIREMPPYEAEKVIGDLVKGWIKTRVDRLKEWIDRNLQQEVQGHDQISLIYRLTTLEYCIVNHIISTNQKYYIPSILTEFWSYFSDILMLVRQVYILMGKCI